MRATLLSLASVLAALPAVAADLPLKTPPVAVAQQYNWAGYYLGVEGGGIFDSSIKATSLDDAFAKFAPKGGVIGGFAGHNWQWGMFVASLEVNLDWAGGSQTNTLTPKIVPAEALVVPTIATKAQIDLFGSARARLGIAPIENLLFYGTGGIAVAHSTGSIIDTGITVATAPTTSVGWVAGAGVEWKILGSPNWLLRGQFLHYDMGKETFAFGGLVQANVPMAQSFNTATAGLSYKFQP